MKRLALDQIWILCLFCFLLFAPVSVQAQEEPVVRAVLFYSPTCPHCHQVINEVLLPMVEEYGGRLQIVAIDVTQVGGQALYQSAIDHFQIPEGRLGVPALLVEDTVLVGSGEIPDQFPGIVYDGLVAGIDWPAIPGFVPPEEAAELTSQATASDTPPATATTVAPATNQATAVATVEPATGEVEPMPEKQSEPVMIDATQSEIALEEAEEPPADPLGFAMAAAILIGMVIACLYVAWRLIVAVPEWRSAGQITSAVSLSWAIPILVVVGIGVAAYLAYVEITQVTAVCGPVGHCNLVQSSPYAQILGIPIAGLGLATYVAIIGLWLVERLTERDTWATAARAGLLALTLFGTLFSIYLTLLELLVIQAVCAWCLTSAVVMTILMILVVRPVTTLPKAAGD